MRRLRPRSTVNVDMVYVILGDDDVDGTLDVVLEQDEVADEFLAVLHQAALEAMARRASWPGDPGPEVGAGPAEAPAAADRHATTWLGRRLGKRRVVQLAVIATAALAVMIAVGVVDARRASARVTALEATPSVLQPVPNPPVELWRMPGRVVSDQADVLLVAGANGGSLQRVDPATGEATELATGEQVDTQGARREPLSLEEYALPGGATATWSWAPDGESGHGSVTRKDGGRAFGLWGPPLVPAITDGSEAGTVVVMSTDGDWLFGWDLRTGRNRWALPYGGAVSVNAAAQVDGVMLLDDGAEVTAIDVRTGTELWSAPIAPGVTHGSALIDGTVVLLPVSGDGTAVDVVARGIADGAQLWRTGTPAGTVALTVVDHHLVASTDDAVVGLG